VSDGSARVAVRGCCGICKGFEVWPGFTGTCSSRHLH